MQDFLTNSSCSPAIVVDTNPPNPATSLSWNEGAFAPSSAVNALWTVGGSADAASQTLTVHTDAACNTAAVVTHSSLGTSVSSHAVTLPSEGSFYFKVESLKASGLVPNQLVLLNNMINHHQAAPSSVTVPASSATLTVDVNFSVGTDANFDTHNIKACTDSACSVGCTAETQSVSSPASAVLFGDSNSYYACVQAKDLAGNTSAYVASASPVVIDATAPVAGNAARIDV